jgi:hypothetical protein
MSAQQLLESSEPLPAVFAAGAFAQCFGKLQQLFVIALERCTDVVGAAHGVAEQGIVQFFNGVGSPKFFERGMRPCGDMASDIPDRTALRPSNNCGNTYKPAPGPSGHHGIREGSSRVNRAKPAQICLCGRRSVP